MLIFFVILNMSSLYSVNSIPLIEIKEQNLLRPYYHVITGSFKKRSLAYEHISDLKKSGFKKAKILPVSKNGYYRVSVDSYSKIILANKLRDNLKKGKYKDAWILKTKLNQKSPNVGTIVNKVKRKINLNKSSDGVDEVIKRVMAKRQNIAGQNKIKKKTDEIENKKIDSKSDLKTSPEVIIIGDQIDSSSENNLPIEANNSKPKVINENNVVIINESEIQQQANNIREFESSDDLNQDSNQQRGRIISGNLKNDQGRPIPGAEVIVLGTSESIITDFDGNFKIRVSNGQKVEISSIGFSRQTIEINDQEGLDVTLKLKSQDSEEQDSATSSKKRREDNLDKNIFIARKQYNKYDYDIVQQKYLDLINSGKETKELLEYLANSFFNNSEYDRAVIWFNRLISKYPKEIAAENYYRASLSFKSQGSYEISDDLLKKYISLTDNLVIKNYYENNPDYLQKISQNAENYSILKTQINSNGSDFGPSFYGDDKIIFSSTASSTGDDLYEWSGERFLDLFIADMDSEGNLINPEPLSDDINTEYHESSAVLTKDKKIMYFTRNNYYSGKLGFDKNKQVNLKIYRTESDDGEVWNNIEELPFNSDEYSVAHPAISVNEKRLYFSSDMPGSFGYSDIWYVDIFEDGTYSEPINLGPQVNTEFRESFPFISEEGVLYFSSDGRIGLGGFDVYLSNLDSRGMPKTSKNLGPPINSRLDDFGFIFSSNRGFGYFSSNRNGIEGSSSDEVYRVEVGDENITYNRFGEPIEDRNFNIGESRTENFSINQSRTNNFSTNDCLEVDCSYFCDVSIRGIIRDKNTREILKGVLVSLIDLNGNILFEQLTKEDGSYSFISEIDCSKKYLITASKPIGYSDHESEIRIPSTSKEIKKDIYLEWRDNCLPNDLVCLLDINPILFDLDKHYITYRASKELKKILTVMFKHPKINISVESHTDSRGSNSYNEALSDRRAKETKAWLVKRGINADRILIRGFGEYNLENYCKDNIDCIEEEHQINRRSIFKIL
jgi:outer membrane protein OmpA-like peptidoglycan-associated protein/tetratricopeptide (TPR) repeat protein